jgi:hypothetical protein
MAAKVREGRRRQSGAGPPDPPQPPTASGHALCCEGKKPKRFGFFLSRHPAFGIEVPQCLMSG